MSNSESLLLSVPQFAQRLSVTPACIRRWIQEHKIATVKLGRVVRIPESEINRLIASGLRPARTAR